VRAGNVEYGYDADGNRVSEALTDEPFDRERARDVEDERTREREFRRSFGVSVSTLQYRLRRENSAAQQAPEKEAAPGPPAQPSL